MARIVRQLFRTAALMSLAIACGGREVQMASGPRTDAGSIDAKMPIPDAGLGCRDFAGKPIRPRYEVRFDEPVSGVYLAAGRDDGTVVVLTQHLMRVGLDGQVTPLPLNPDFQPIGNSIAMSRRGNALFSSSRTKITLLDGDGGPLATWSPSAPSFFVYPTFSEAGTLVATPLATEGHGLDAALPIEVRTLEGAIAAELESGGVAMRVPASGDVILRALHGVLTAQRFDGSVAWTSDLGGPIFDFATSDDGRDVIVAMRDVLQKVDDSVVHVRDGVASPPHSGFPVYQSVMARRGRWSATRSLAPMHVALFEDRALKEEFYPGFDAPGALYVLEVNDDGRMLVAGRTGDQTGQVQLMRSTGEADISCTDFEPNSFYPQVLFAGAGRHAVFLWSDRLDLFDLP